MNDFLIETIVNDWIDRFIILEDDEDGEEKKAKSHEVTNARKEILNYLNELIANGNTDVIDYAKEMGINLDYKNGIDYNIPRLNWKISNNDADVRGIVPQEITDYVLKYSQILKGYVETVSEVGKGNFFFDKLKKDHPSDYRDIMNAKDFIDRIGLSFLYDSTKEFGLNAKDERYGIKYNTDDNTYDASNFNLNTVSNKHLNRWLEGGKDDNKRKYKYSEYAAKIEMAKNMIDAYLDSIYGIEMSVPDFSLGNNKVKKAMIVNFISGFRCPAWNYCVVKNACYARSGEMQHYNAKESNDKKNLLWITAQKDDKMRQLMFNFLKVTAIDYGKAAKTLNVNTEKLINTNISELDENTCNILSKCARVHDVRLNENGDFLNKDFLKMIDDFAGELKRVGINVAAYTCQNLNFKGVKNIIINASRSEINGNCVARYFYAIPEEMYNLYDETYGSMDIKDKFNAIEQIPKPLYNIKTGEPTGNFYYKCPCARKDFIIGGKKDKDTEVNCYQCHLCYEPKNEKIKGKYFVFVKAHGTQSTKLNPERMEKVENEIGVSENYIENKQRTGNKVVKEENLNENNLINDNYFSFNEMKNEAYDVITKNAVYSMNQKIDSLKNSIMEEKKKFFDTLKLLK